MPPKTIKTPDQKLDEDFPPLSSLPKTNPPNQPSVSRAHSTSQLPSNVSQPASSPLQQSNPPQQQSTQPFDLFPSSDARSSENLLQTELTQQDFCRALSSEMNLIPDPPYDSHDVVRTENTIDTPPSYPQTKNMKLVQPEFFKKYDLSTLFFIFFYSPGTSQQYFAGRELQNRDWHYHIKFQTWFHRIEEPKEKTPEFEISKFEYFDHSTSEGWCVRKRDNFKLEFNYIAK